MEGDAKICFDALNGNEDCNHWKIDFICSDSKMLSFLFISHCFFWVRREANNVAHVMAKFALVQNHAFCCNKTYLPLFFGLG